VAAPVKLLVAGDGTQRQHAERLAAERGLGDRVAFLGTVDDDALIELYAGAAAVLYPPFDEDFGYVTLEAFLSRKPVVTATDSGGPLEFVEEGVIRRPPPGRVAGRGRLR
jgi:glycosyltransferase involved in cell wall biosynthesis